MNNKLERLIFDTLKKIGILDQLAEACCHTIEETRCHTCKEKRTCPAFDTGPIYPCPDYKEEKGE